MPRASSDNKKTNSPPPLSPEAYENRLISKAYKSVEQRIDNGEATAQELVHFLKLGSTKEQLELEKLKKENELLRVKADAIQSQKEVKELYTEAIDAFRKYSGLQGLRDDEE